MDSSDETKNVLALKQEFEKQIGIRFFSNQMSKRFGGTIKNSFEDFVVKEISSDGNIIDQANFVKDNTGGLFTQCILKKEGIDTLSALKKIESHFGLSQKDIGYAGLKDAFAITQQLISLWNIDVTLIESFNTNNHNIKLINPTKIIHQIFLGQLQGNYFEIKVQDLKVFPSIKEMDQLTHLLEEKGVLNYFGPQRFGSKRPILHLFGKYLLQKRFDKAIQTYIGHFSPLEHSSIQKIRKGFLIEQDYKLCLDLLPNRFQFEKKMLRGKVKGWSDMRIIDSLPIEFLKLSIAAYQSYLYNNTLSWLIEEKVNLDVEKIPIPGSLTKSLRGIPTELITNFEKLLAQDELRFSSFKGNKRYLKVKGSKRKPRFYPKNVNLKGSPSKKDLLLKFSLPPGSYATMLLREVTGSLF